MTTSSSDRCTRISPSAVLDDRLDGKDLEWARDHLRRCEACRERVEDFREMLLRVGRLPKATLGAAAMDEAYSVSVPQRLRDDAGIRTYELSAPDTSRMVQPVSALPSTIRPEVTSVRDLMSELEREIFREEPAHPTPLAAAPEPVLPTMAPPPEPEPEPPPKAGLESGEPATDETHEYEEAQSLPVIEPVEHPAPPSWRQVPIESQRPAAPANPPLPPAAAPVLPVEPHAGSDETDWARLLETIANAPDPDAGLNNPEPVPPSRPFVEPVPLVEPVSLSEPVPRATTPEPASSSVRESRWEPDQVPAGFEPPSSHRNVIYGEEPAITFAEAEPAPATRRSVSGPSTTVMRLAVGVGAAACLLIAALLYAGGYLVKPQQHLSASSASAAATHKPSAHPSPSARASLSATPAPTPAAPSGTVLYTLGNGVSGNAVFRIRPGTAVAGYTRLVFDMHGSGLPTMVITQPDADHVQITFKNASVTGVPVNGIQSYQVAAVEPGVQSGPDGSFLIDLAHPVRVTAFTLPATGGYAWRLVVDLHTS